MAIAREAALAMLDRAGHAARWFSDEDFRGVAAWFGGSSIGQHLRHALDHFEQFVRGLAAGEIDYDDRVRGGIEESCRSTLARRAEELAARLDEALFGLEADGVVSVRTACSVDGSVESHISTCGRELQFLVSHTVHHFAIVAAIARARGLEIDPQFGVAPSTLRFRAGE